MKKFTQSKQTTLKGWTLWHDRGMHQSEFTINRHGFSARADGEIWDYSDDPYEFAEFIKDGNVWKEISILEDKIEYTNPTKLSDWLKENLK
jgi:hypothetical protein